jgi:beta-glucosidase
MVAVLMTGRPLVIPRVAHQVDALLVAWHGGIRAGRAVSDLLFGAASPSGKLTTSWPRTEGQIPVYYAHKSTGRPAGGTGTVQFDQPFKCTYLDEPNSPLFPFGFGLSYTTFAYHDLVIEQPVVNVEGSLRVTAVVENAGRREGTEVVQLYVRDLVASVTRPVRELKAFERVTVQPGERRTVRFEVPARELGFIGPEMLYVVEPGRFKVWVGPDSTAGLEAEFEVRDGPDAPRPHVVARSESTSAPTS